MMPQQSKLRWGELEEDDGEDLDYLLPPKRAIGPDENGIKQTIEYKFSEENQKVRVTTTTRGARQKKQRSQETPQLAWRHRVLFSRRAGTVGRRVITGLLDGPYKDAMSLLADGTMDKPTDVKPAAGPATKDTYVSPGLRSGASERLGTDMRRRNEKNSLRVTNLSEDTPEPDLQELFRPFGMITRVYVSMDQKTGTSRGFGFVNFVNREDAEKAINKLNGYGYDNLILRVEWATPRAT
ncbi:Eukaryotic translation initiation factor 3 subunit G-like protein [Drosera capensis]